MTIRHLLGAALVTAAATGVAGAADATVVPAGATVEHAAIDGQAFRLVGSVDDDTRSVSVLIAEVDGRPADDPFSTALGRTPDDVRWFGGDRDAALAAAGLDVETVTGWTAAGAFTVERTVDGAVTSIEVGADSVRVDVPRVIAERAPGWERAEAAVEINGAVARFDGEAYHDALTEERPLLTDSWIDARRFGHGVRGMALLVEAARRNAMLGSSDCVWECLYCGGLWVATGISAAATTATCLTVVGCIVGGANTVLIFGAAVDNCLACDRCLHPSPGPGTEIGAEPEPEPEPEPVCPEGFGACSPNSTFCCELPHCPYGFAPCDHDPMVCCSASECLPPDCVQ